MNEQDKQLLLKDLCGRIPYRVKCCVYVDANDSFELSGLKDIDTAYFESLDRKGNDGLVELQFVKPYLRPMSSMTEEEIIDYHRSCICVQYDEYTIFYDTARSLDYLNSIHVDYRGLIEMGLALEAPEGMYDN